MAIRTWRACARVLSMSEDTLQRHRTRFGDQTPTPPWFRDEEAVIAWDAAMRAPAPQPPQRRRRADGPIDPRAVARDLTRAP